MSLVNAFNGYQKAVMTVTHVPAWRKLGLKLKNAKDEDAVESQIQPASEELVTRKRKSSGENNTDVRNGAKHRKRPKASIEKSESDDKEHSVQPKDTTPSSKRKSVSFTADTKLEDGDGVKQLYKTWSSSQKVNDPDFNASNLPQALKLTDQNNTKSTESKPRKASNTRPKEDRAPTATIQAENKEKKKPKKKRKKKKKVESEALPTDSVRDQLSTYLTSYHISSPEWKFSKTHQNRLVRNIFSFAHVPASYDAPLLSYLRGLASTAVRNLIREQALKARKEDQEQKIPAESEDTTAGSDIPAQSDTSAPRRKDSNMGLEQVYARKQMEYDAAVARMTEALHAREEMRDEWAEHVEWTERMQKRRRAELILWSVGEETELQPQQTPPPPSLQNPRNTTIGASNARIAIVPPPLQPNHQQFSNPLTSLSSSSSFFTPFTTLPPGPSQQQHNTPNAGNLHNITISNILINGITNGTNPTTTAPSTKAPTPTNGTTTSSKRRKRLRKHKQKSKPKPFQKDPLLANHAIPDDISSTKSSSSSSDSNSDSNPDLDSRVSKKAKRAAEKLNEEEDRERQREKQRESLAERRRALEEARREAEESLDSSASDDGSVTVGHGEGQEDDDDGMA